MHGESCRGTRHIAAAISAIVVRQNLRVVIPGNFFGWVAGRGVHIPTLAHVLVSSCRWNHFWNWRRREWRLRVLDTHSRRRWSDRCVGSGRNVATRHFDRGCPLGRPFKRLQRLLECIRFSPTNDPPGIPGRAAVVGHLGALPDSCQYAAWSSPVCFVDAQSNAFDSSTSDRCQQWLHLSTLSKLVLHISGQPECHRSLCRNY